MADSLTTRVASRSAEMGVMLVSDMHRAIGRGSVRGTAVRTVGEIDRDVMLYEM